MPSKGKIKGSNYERELVNEFKDLGFEAKRAYASNGQSLGYHEEVDLVVKASYNGIPFNLKLQAKRRKKIPSFLGLTKNVDAVVFREDKGDSYIMMRLNDFIDYHLITGIDNNETKR